MSSNCSRETKWYSRPFTSVARGERVVWEIEKRRSRNSPRRRVFIVVLPAPEGEDRMRSSQSSSFDILHLLPEPLDLGLGVDHGPRHAGILGLGADGVHLARDLLEEEI